MMQKNIQNLQILRFIAATVVVYYHIVGTPTHSLPLPDFGSFGVDIFFCLSGFVMAMLVKNGEKPLSFITNRFIRIAPLYWIFTTLILVLTFVKPDLFAHTTSNWENYFKSLFFIPYFKESGLMHPMLAMGWTLNYEMLFYAVIAIAIGISRKHTLIVTTALLFALYFIGKASNHAEISKFLGSELLFEFLFGIVIYHFWQKNKFHWLPINTAIMLFIISLITIAVIEAHKLGINRTLSFGIPAALIVITSLRCEELLNPKSKITKTLTAMGDASYATYITHFFVVMFVKKILDAKFNIIIATSPVGVLLGVFLSLIVGQLVYILLDKPISGYLKKRLLKKTLA